MVSVTGDWAIQNKTHEPVLKIKRKKIRKQRGEGGRGWGEREKKKSE